MILVKAVSLVLEQVCTFSGSAKKLGKLRKILILTIFLMSIKRDWFLKVSQLTSENYEKVAGYIRY
jgi:hypothetical protein